MNGIPVCPSPKTENAPTWRPRSPLFWASFSPLFGLFLHRFYTPDLVSTIPNTQPTLAPYIV